MKGIKMITSKELKEQTASLEKNLISKEDFKALLNKIEVTNNIAQEAIEAGKELVDMLKKVKEERDMYRDLRNIDSHRIGIATQSIDSLEEELRIMQETYEPERKAI
jgi:hypothetical protein